MRQQPKFLLIALAFFALSGIAFAQSPSIPYWGQGGLLSCTQGIGGSCSLCDLFRTFRNFVYFGITLVTFAFGPVLIAWGGLMILTSGGDEGRLEGGKKILTGSLVGVALALGSFLIVNTFFLWFNQNPAFKISWLNIDCGRLNNLLPAPVSLPAPPAVVSTYPTLPATTHLESLDSLGISHYQMTHDSASVNSAGVVTLQRISADAQGIDPKAAISGACDGPICGVQTYDHSDLAHHIGCAFDFSGFTSCTEVKKFVTEAQNSGAFRVLNEYMTLNGQNCGGQSYEHTTGGNVHVDVCSP